MWPTVGHYTDFISVLRCILTHFLLTKTTLAAAMSFSRLSLPPPSESTSPSKPERRLSPAYFKINEREFDAEANATATANGGGSKSQEHPGATNLKESEALAAQGGDGDGAGAVKPPEVNEGPLPTLASRFVPHPGASVEYILSIAIDRKEGQPVTPGTSHSPVVAAHYPEASLDHSRLDFEEKCRSIGQFLFPYQMQYVTREDVLAAEERKDIVVSKNSPTVVRGTLSHPYSFMFVGTDSDYSKFYAHCSVVHVVSGVDSAFALHEQSAIVTIAMLAIWFLDVFSLSRPL